MLCNSGWSWMFKARSMKKIRQREMLSDQFFTVGDLRWLTCCRTVGDHDPGMPNFLTKVRESDAERVRRPSERPSELNLQHIEELALSDMAFFKPFMYSWSFHIFSSFSGMHWELPEKKNWITQMMRPTRPFEKKRTIESTIGILRAFSRSWWSFWNTWLMVGQRFSGGHWTEEILMLTWKLMASAATARLRSIAVLFRCLLSMNFLHPEGEGWVQRMNQRTAI